MSDTIIPWANVLIGMQIMMFGMLAFLVFIEVGASEMAALNILMLCSIAGILALTAPALGYAYNTARRLAGL